MQLINVNPTLVVAAVAGLLTLLIGWKRPFLVLSALVILIPFRDFITRWLNAHTELSIEQVTAVGRWWAGVVVALLLLVGFRWLVERISLRRLPRLGFVDIMLAIAVALAVVGALSSPNRTAGLISLRGYLQSIPVFLLARLIVPSRKEVHALLPLWLAIGSIVSIFAIVQALTWDEATFRAEEYTRPNGQLVVPTAGISGEQYLRPASTVSGPNELGLDMIILISIVLFWLLARRRRWTGLLVVLVMLFAAGLAVSASRSAALGLVAASAATFAMRWGDMRSWLHDQTTRARGTLIISGALAMVLVVLVLSSTGLPALIGETIQTLPNQYHYVDTAEAIQFLVEHPEGAGMGLIRPKAALDFLALENVYHVEGSLFQIAVEMGVLGLLAWGAFFGSALIAIVRSHRKLSAKPLKILSGAAVASWAAALVAFFILPLMQSVSLMIWLWFLLGIGLASPVIDDDWAKLSPAISR